MSGIHCCKNITLVIIVDSFTHAFDDAVKQSALFVKFCTSSTNSQEKMFGGGSMGKKQKPFALLEVRVPLE